MQYRRLFWRLQTIGSPFSLTPESLFAFLALNLTLCLPLLDSYKATKKRRADVSITEYEIEHAVRGVSNIKLGALPWLEEVFFSRGYAHLVAFFRPWHISTAFFYALALPKSFSNLYCLAFEPLLRAASTRRRAIFSIKFGRRRGSSTPSSRSSRVDGTSTIRTF